jgi:hypothetical protein
MSICLAYIHHPKDDEFLDRSLEVMTQQTWVNRIVVLHTAEQQVSWQTRSKLITHVYRDFGQGFDKQPEDGGFHELAARNEMLTWARASECDWILICDSDEIYLPMTKDHITEADMKRKSVVWFPCYHFCSPTQYLWWPNTVRKISGVAMHDPHPRAIRATAKIRYELNRNNHLRGELPNRTMHCHLQNTIRKRQYWAKQGVCHVHTRHMFDPKRPDAKWFENQKPRSFDSGLPDTITKAFTEQDNEAYCLCGIHPR